jgi:hypothetical protein
MKPVTAWSARALESRLTPASASQSNCIGKPLQRSRPRVLAKALDFLACSGCWSADFALPIRYTRLTRPQSGLLLRRQQFLFAGQLAWALQRMSERDFSRDTVAPSRPGSQRGRDTHRRESSLRRLNRRNHRMDCQDGDLRRCDSGRPSGHRRKVLSAAASCPYINSGAAPFRADHLACRAGYFLQFQNVSRNDTRAKQAWSCRGYSLFVPNSGLRILAPQWSQADQFRANGVARSYWR